MSLIPLKDADETEIAMCHSMRRPKNHERYQRMIAASSARHERFMQSRPEKVAPVEPEKPPAPVPYIISQYEVTYEKLPWQEAEQKDKPTATVKNPKVQKQRGEQIIEEVCEQHGLPIVMVMGHSRSRSLVFARQEIMYRMTVELGYSTSMVGRFMKRDHSTIVYGRQQHAKRCGLPMSWVTTKKQD
jgi:hypothetical protein